MLTTRNMHSLQKQAKEEGPFFELPTVPLQRPAPCDGDWKGKRCFIIGGGPSVDKEALRSLSDELTIGTNRAFEFMDCTINLSMDLRFWDWVREGKIGKNFKERTGAWLHVDTSNGRVKYSPDSGFHILPLRRSPKELSPSLKEGLSGNNCGLAALNLAICLGASEIYLLGFDMSSNGKGIQSHFHEGYPRKQKDSVYSGFIAAFEAIASEARAKAQIINLNPESGLRCFPFGKFPMIQKGPLIFKGFLGFGDNLYQRPLVRHLSKNFNLYLETPVPEMYWDIPGLNFLKPNTKLRTQTDHMKEVSPSVWTKEPRASFFSWRSSPNLQAHGNVIDRLKENFTGPFDFTFPVKEEWKREAEKVLASLDLKGKKVCIVRKPSIRKEWEAPARNPDPNAFKEAALLCSDSYFLLSLANVDGKDEVFVGEVPVDAELTLPLTTVFGLVYLADLVLCFPSFFMVLGIAIRTRTFCVWGQHRLPEELLHPEMDLRDFGYVIPDSLCRCLESHCKHEKTIEKERLRKELSDFIGSRQETLVVLAGIGDIHWVLTKLQDYKRKNKISHLTLDVHEDQYHLNTHDFLKCVPFVDSVIDSYGCSFPYDTNLDIWTSDPRSDKGIKCIQFNNILETGVPLEEVLPEYECDWDYPLDLPVVDLEHDYGLRPEERFIVLYPSSELINDAWVKKDWSLDNWIELAYLFEEEFGYRSFFVGAAWDLSWGEKTGLQPHLVDLIGCTDFGQVMALIRRSEVFIGLPSGLLVLSTKFEVPSVSLWPERKTPSGIMWFSKKFQTCWVNPAVLKKGIYRPVSFGSSECNVRGVYELAKEGMRNGNRSRWVN